MTFQPNLTETRNLLGCLAHSPQPTAHSPQPTNDVDNNFLVHTDTVENINYNLQIQSTRKR